ncbi:caspase family protein [Streptomyces tuirus]|uniref:Caspase family protein n=1 Tax=Streptomyces tuirus TaxID=68278 RepID=A0A941J3Z4_9ACTN|nr:caspase family protein [Streptomyces tuirus]
MVRSLRRATSGEYVPHGAERRFLVSIGVGAYRDAGIADLPQALPDATRVRDLLAPMGYEPALAEVSANPTADALRRGIDRWAAGTDLGPRDVVVLYFAGHGAKAPDRHYLLCADTEPGLWSSALASEDLCRPLMYSPLGHLLVIVDTCYAGAGATDLATLAAELATTQRGAAGRWLLASARGKEQARENAFVDALSDVLARPRAGAHPEFVGVREVTERINEHFRTRHLRQHARMFTVDSDGHAPFFRNPAHIAGLPVDDLDVAAMARLRGRTRGHFDPRGRGLEHLGEYGDHFVGRTSALAELARWLHEPHDRRARIVTGGPGSGKSALLGRLLLLSDPDHPARTRTPAEALPPPGMPVVPLHARRAGLEDLTAALGGAIGLPGAERDDLLEALSRRTKPVTVVVDALDEAGTSGDGLEGTRIACELLQPLSTLPALRLVVGTRRPLLAALGHATVVLDLDQPGHFTAADVTAYARGLLMDAHDPDSRSPYRGRPEAVEPVARAIADRAGNCFLVARMTARALVHGQVQVDLARPGWEQGLPSDAGQAFAAYLARFGPHRAKVVRLLRPLAYAQGAGLPWSTLWAPVAEALSGVGCPHEDLEWLHESAGSYLVETAAPGGSVYRLFHETMAEYLRTPGGGTTAHRAIVDALLAQVPEDPLTHRRDWTSAHPYIRNHLADHAAAGGVLDRLLDDSGFLVHASPVSLMRALRTAPPSPGRLPASIYRASAIAHTDATPTQRQDVLAIDAARFNQPAGRLRDIARQRPWRPLWATGNLVHPAMRSALTGHSGSAAVACVGIDGRPHAVTVDGGRLDFRDNRFSDGTVRVWDLTTGAQTAAFTGHRGEISDVDCYTHEGRPYAVTISPEDLLGNGKGDGTVRVWNLADGTSRRIRPGYLGLMVAVAATVIDGHPHAVTVNQTGEASVRVWNLTTGALRLQLTGHSGAVSSVVCCTVDGRPHAVVGCFDSKVWVWDLTTGIPRAALAGHTSTVTAVACTQIDGHPHAVSGASDRTVRVWNLTHGTERAVLTGHTSDVYAVACTDIDGRPHAVTGDQYREVRVWDLTDGGQRALLKSPSGLSRSFACTTVGGRPHAVTSGYDTAHVWDLTESTHGRITRPGHSASLSAAACATIDGRPHVITGARDDTLRVWDLRAGTVRAVLTGHGGTTWGGGPALSCTTIDGRPHAVSGAPDKTVRVWDLTEGVQHSVRTGHTNTVHSVACTTVDGRPHAISASADNTVRVWDLTDETGPERIIRVWFRSGHQHYGLACADIDGRPHVLVAGGVREREVHVRDLTDDTAQTVLACDMAGVTALACTDIAGTPHAVLCGNGIEVWNLARGTRRATLARHPDRVSAVACARVDGRPFAFTTRSDRTVRMWDLETNEPVETITLPMAGGSIAVTGDALVVTMSEEVVVLTRQGGDLTA